MASIPVVQAQNLVYNGSFEEYSECPQSNELNNGQFERAIGWFRPTLGTPDYYNRCNSGLVGVPLNFWGYQEPYEGDGYAGFGAIVWDKDGNNLGNEYIRTELICPLKPCIEYNFRMYVSLANISTHGVGKLGVLFTIDNQFTETFYTLTQVPQIIYEDSPILDTSNWVLIEGSFIAQGFEKYLTIGYFQDNVNMDTASIQDFGFNSEALYYVDSISVYEVGNLSTDLCDLGEIVFPNIITPNNDGVNDYLDASSYFVITDEITIMNRWGNVITVLTQENPVWDGRTTSGALCTEGTYFYNLSYEWGTQTKEKSGFIQLVR